MARNISRPIRKDFTGPQTSIRSVGSESPAPAPKMTMPRGSRPDRGDQPDADHLASKMDHPGRGAALGTENPLGKSLRESPLEDWERDLIEHHLTKSAERQRALDERRRKMFEQ